MLERPNCHKRKCRHFYGVRNTDGTEKTEYLSCRAFPEAEGIPLEIAWGDNLHEKPLKDQGNDIVYEKKEE